MAGTGKLPFLHDEIFEWLISHRCEPRAKQAAVALATVPDMPVNWTLETDEVIALPMDGLALLVLRDAIANKKWNAVNWLVATNLMAE